MKNIRNIFFLFLLAFVFCTCRRPRPEPIYKALSPELKAWCAYNQGTWWTYKELASNNRDSSWVNYYSEDKSHGSDDFYFYLLVIYIASSNDSFGIHHFYAEPFNPAYQNPDEWALVETYSLGQGNGYAAGRLYYTGAGALTLPPNMAVTKLDSFALVTSGDIYYNVIKTTNSISEYGNWIKTEYYARNIGVIRREMFNGEIWELENFNIVH
ncbi:MAG: hypothetical protein ABIQ40_06500 [Bacteroidia bacterium]